VRPESVAKRRGLVRATIPCGVVVNRRPRLEIVAPSASPEEAAAVVAALERFMRDHCGPPPAPSEPRRNPWQRAAMLEATTWEPDEPSAWGDPCLGG